MLLAIDIGNTNILAGCFEGERLIHECRLKSDAYQTVDEYTALLFSLWREHFGEKRSFSKVIISSVVPPLTDKFIAICRERLSLEPVIVGPGVKTGLEIRAKDPAAVGADRVVNAVAVRELYGPGAIIIDFGTATSFDVLDTSGAYLGGVIAPGLEISVDALVNRTAKLPKIDLHWPVTVVGGDTVSAMQSGCLVGYVCLVEGVVAKIQQEVPGLEHIIATGGIGKIIASHTECISVYNRHLTLQGMQVIAGLNA